MKSMKRNGQRTGDMLRISIVILLIGCLLLSTGCTPKTEDPTQPSETLPPQDPLPTDTEPDDPEDPRISVTLLRQGMVDTPNAFAAAYFGFQYNPDSDDPVDPFAVMAAEAPQLCADLPFLLAVPEERVLGDQGELYCIVPRDEDATVAVNRGVWDEEKEAFVYDEVIYRGESGDPVLLFCNAEGWEPDTQVIITCSDGTVVTWYPTVNIHLRCIDPLRNEDGADLLFDFSPYGESLAKDYREFAGDGWEYPTEADLIGVTWGYYTFLDDNRKATYQVTFQEDTCHVRWYDGIDGETHEYADAPWELTREGEFAVLTIDFREFAGVHRYNLLIEREYELLYIALDASEGFVMAGWEPLHQLLEPAAPAPDPAGMVGTWELAWTEVEGDRNEVQPGRMKIVITQGSAANLFMISMTDNAIPELSFKNKDLEVVPGALYHGCGNDQWTGYVDHVGLYDTYYALTLLGDGTLLVQDAWEFDGMQMVSYGWYNRVD